MEDSSLYHNLTEQQAGEEPGALITKWSMFFSH